MPGGAVARREVVEHFGAVAVVALDDDDRVAWSTSTGTRWGAGCGSCRPACSMWAGKPRR